jgi:hypothetical protein
MADTITSQNIELPPWTSVYVMSYICDEWIEALTVTRLFLVAWGAVRLSPLGTSASELAYYTSPRW